MSDVHFFLYFRTSFGILSWSASWSLSGTQKIRFSGTFRYCLLNEVQKLRFVEVFCRNLFCVVHMVIHLDSWELFSLTVKSLEKDVLFLGSGICGSLDRTVVAAPFRRGHKRLVKVFLNFMMRRLDSVKEGNRIFSLKMKNGQLFWFIWQCDQLLIGGAGMVSFLLYKEFR